MKFVLFFLALLLNQGISSQMLHDSLKMSSHVVEVSSGLKFLLTPVEGANVVSVEFWVPVGTADEENTQHGLAHFFEHVTPYGFNSEPDKRNRLRELITDSNAQTLKDFTRYMIEVKPEGLSLALEYTAQRLNSSPIDIDSAKVEKERTRVLKEIDRNNKSVFWSVEGSRAMNMATYGEDHPYGHGPYGSLENNQKFQLEDFRKWFQKYFQPSTVFIMITGKFDLYETEIELEKTLGSIPYDKSKYRTFTHPSDGFSKISDTIHVETDANTHALSYTWKIPGYGDPTNPSFRVLQHLLDTSIRAIENFEGSSSEMLDFHGAAGQFGMNIKFNNIEHQSAVLAVMGEQVKRLRKVDFSNEQIAAAIKMEFDDIAARMEYMGFQYSRSELLGLGYFYKGDPEFYMQQLRAIADITLEDLQKVVNQYLSEVPGVVWYWGKLTK